MWGLRRGAPSRATLRSPGTAILGSAQVLDFTCSTGSRSTRLISIAGYAQHAKGARQSPCVCRSLVECLVGGGVYWCFYDTRIPLEDLDAVLGKEAPKARHLLRAMELAGLEVRNKRYLELTEPGAFWLHLVQNHFALSYVNTLWTEARRGPWPQTVDI